MNEQIGYFALDFAVGIYVVQMFPQLWKTASQAYVTDLSIGMIRLLWLGYFMDVLYAKQHDMPAQYLFVSCLGTAQIIIWIFLLWQKKLFSLKEFAVLSTSAVFVLVSPLNWLMKLTFIPVLSISQSCFWMCWISQVMCSFALKSAKDISLLTVLLSLLGTMCSCVASYTLGWEQQYIANLILMTIFHVVILLALLYYRRHSVYS